METVDIPHTGKKVCRVGLGTWAIGGWLWGGTDESESIKTIHRALDLGISLIDTAPVYGFGRSEELVGKALKSSPKRHQAVIATKAGLNWEDKRPFRDARKARILEEVDLSLKRLGVEQIDLYQIHWPDPQTPVEETAEAMRLLLETGKIAAIGVSNFSPEMMEKFRQAAPLHSLQSPYNLFERDIEKSELPYCRQHGMVLLGYGALCRGLLSGKMDAKRQFEGDDIRKVDPKFQEPQFAHYLTCVEQLNRWAEEKYGKSVLHLALRWVLDRGIDIPLWGARRPEQLEPLEEVWDWQLSESDQNEIEALVDQTVVNPVGPGFMAPPSQHTKGRVEA